MPVRRLIRTKDVLATVQSSKSKLYSDIADGTFPAPIKWGRSSYFLADEVNEWIEQRVAERNAKVARKSRNKPSAA